MTTPAERTEAVKTVYPLIDSMLETINASNLGLSEKQRAQYFFVARHSPTIGELELTHEKCPELWGKP